MCESRRRSVFLPASLSGIYEQTHCTGMFYRSLFPNRLSFADSSNFGVKGTYIFLSILFSVFYHMPTYLCRYLKLQDICNALVFMLNKVKIMQVAVQCNIKRMWIKKITSFFFNVIWCCPLIYSFTTQYLKSSCHK